MTYQIVVHPARPQFYCYNIKFSYSDKTQGRMRITILGYESYLTDDYQITNEFGSALYGRHCSTKQIWKVQELLAKHCNAQEEGKTPWICITLHRDSGTDDANDTDDEQLNQDLMKDAIGSAGDSDTDSNEDEQTPANPEPYGRRDIHACVSP